MVVNRTYNTIIIGERRDFFGIGFFCLRVFEEAHNCLMLPPPPSLHVLLPPSPLLFAPAIPLIIGYICILMQKTVPLTCVVFHTWTTAFADLCRYGEIWGAKEKVERGEEGWRRAKADENLVIITATIFAQENVVCRFLW